MPRVRLRSFPRMTGRLSEDIESEAALEEEEGWSFDLESLVELVDELFTMLDELAICKK